MTTAPAPAFLVDGEPGEGIPVDDRGLAYGDGLFETILFQAGQAPLWRGHMARLRHGARRLGLPVPAAPRLWSEAVAVAGHGGCVVKILLTRGSGQGQGYASAGSGQSRRIVRAQPMRPLPAAAYADGVRVRWCRLRLAGQPALAGLKHLNRLEQVLARAEWRDPALHEGLCLDAEDHLVCATAANVFLVRDGRLLTPRLDRCGVAGVARAWILARAGKLMPCAEARLTRADVEAADEVFLSNAVRGIVPVRAIGRWRYRVGPVATGLGYTLAGLGIGLPPAFAAE